MKDWEFPSGEPSEFYCGPVEYINPTYGQGYAKMFCPRCGSTDLESLERYDRKLRCRRCGRVFELVLYPNNEGREYSINYCGEPKYNNLHADDVNYETCGTVVDCEDDGRLNELASSYYGGAYDDLYSDECDVMDSAEIRRRLSFDVPFVEIDHLTEEGYIGGMEVGDEIFVPGTDVSIVRTKNSKARKGKRSARLGFRRRGHEETAY